MSARPSRHSGAISIAGPAGGAVENFRRLLEQRRGQTGRGQRLEPDGAATAGIPAAGVPWNSVAGGQFDQLHAEAPACVRDEMPAARAAQTIGVGGQVRAGPHQQNGCGDARRQRPGERIRADRSQVGRWGRRAGPDQHSGLPFQRNHLAALLRHAPRQAQITGADVQPLCRSVRQSSWPVPASSAYRTPPVSPAKTIP